MIWTALALAIAAPAEQQAYIYSFPGNDTCGNWTENRRLPQSRNQALEGWVLGFVSGYNVYEDPKGNVAPGVSGLGLLAWVDQYCAANPLDTLFTAGVKLVIELRKRH